MDTANTETATVTQGDATTTEKPANLTDEWANNIQAGQEVNTRTGLFDHIHNPTDLLVALNRLGSSIRKHRKTENR